MKILKKINISYQQNKPFVAFRKPQAKLLSGFFMDDDNLFFTEKYTESGFVFAPFNATTKSILFPIEKSEFITEELNFEPLSDIEKSTKTNQYSKKTHIEIVNKAIDIIHNSELQKIVISRKEEQQIENFDLVNIFKKLLTHYQDAFVYVWFHPKVGLWFGATPETLLNVQGNNFKTMSLAGTQVFKNQEQPVWKSKELEEQQLVTYFIENQLKDISSNLTIDKTETIRAGNLLHLRTKVQGVLNKKASLKSLLKALHPTPAVCGLPRNKARTFIEENENYDRSYYTGFLGELNLNGVSADEKSSKLYVNLRCMSIQNNTASIYVGGGITKDSNAEKEWEETVFKSKTMMKVL